MMASTMTIPQLAAFHGPMPRPMPGAIQGSVPSGPMPGNFANQVPVSMQGPVNVIPGQVPTSNNSPAATISPPVQTLRLPVVPVGGGCYNDGMEVVWHGEFSRLFSSFFPPHVWYLSITNSAPQEKWKFYRDSAKVRFCCQDCGNGWTSMKGRVTFWFHLNPATSEGFVQFKLYGQVCKKCNSGKFEYVMWYPEEVSKVMCNLYNKVGQTFYGFMQPPIRIDRRPGRPRNQHNAELCQACRDGECDQGRPMKALYNYIQSPLNLRAPNQAIPGRPPMPPNSIGPMNQMPVVISQQPLHHSGQLIVQNALSSTPHSGASLITAPVTLTSGIQPILTYSIVTGQTKDAAKLTPVPEDDSKSEDSSQATTNGNSTPPSPTTVPDNTTITKSVPIDAVAAKLAAINIKSPLINGVATMKNGRNVNLPNSIPKPLQNGTAAIKPPMTSKPQNSAKKMSLAATTNGQSEKIEMKQPKIPTVNGYSTAVTGKQAEPVNGVEDK